MGQVGFAGVKSDKFTVQGWLLLPKDLRSGEEISADCGGAWRPAAAADAHWAVAAG